MFMAATSSPSRAESRQFSELVDLKCDVIVATGGGATLTLLKQATRTIPVVMTAAPDPVAQGYVQSLARRRHQPEAPSCCCHPIAQRLFETSTRS
jgi:ABC-type uncharacterized transport system substrate-binding protein